MKKIMFVSNTFYPFPGGRQKGLYETIRRLELKYDIFFTIPSFLRMKKKYFRRTKMVYIPCPVKLFDSSFFRTFKKYFFTILGAFIYIPNVIKKEKIDLLYVTGAEPFGLTAALIGKIIGKKVILSLHGADITSFRKNSRLLRIYQNIILAKVDAVASVSPSFFNEIKRRDRLYFTPNGIDTQYFKPQTKKKFDFLFVSDCSTKWRVKNKGVIPMFRSLEKLSKTFSTKWSMYFIGNYPEELRRENPHLNSLKKNIKFTGVIDKKHVKNYMQNSQIFLIPSTDGEGMPNALLEAMASGVACIGTDDGAIPYMIENGKSGIIVQRNNSEQLYKAMKKLLNNKILRDKLGKNARKTVSENFTWKNKIISIEKMFKDIGFD